MCPRGVAEAAARSRLHTEELRSVACNETTASSLLGRRCAQLSTPVRVLLVVVSTPEELEDLTKLAPSALKHCPRHQYVELPTSAIGTRLSEAAVRPVRPARTLP